MTDWIVVSRLWVQIQEFLPIKWNLIRLGGPTHGIVTKTVHKTLPGGDGDLEGRGWWVGIGGGQGGRLVGLGWWGSSGRDVGVKGIGVAGQRRWRRGGRVKEVRVKQWDKENGGVMQWLAFLEYSFLSIKKPSHIDYYCCRKNKIDS